MHLRHGVRGVQVGIFETDGFENHCTFCKQLKHRALSSTRGVKSMSTCTAFNNTVEKKWARGRKSFRMSSTQWVGTVPSLAVGAEEATVEEATVAVMGASGGLL